MKKPWMHVTKKLWIHLKIILVLINAAEKSVLNVQMGIHSNGFYYGSIHKFLEDLFKYKLDF